MRALLSILYRTAEILGCLFLVLVAVFMLSQVFGRLLGMQVPALDEFGGYAMAASAFLMLGPALRAGAQIRVGILVERMTGKPRRALEIACLVFAAALSAYFTWFWIGMTLDSYKFGDLSQGVIPTPLWVPQAAMAFGLVVLVIALVDDLIVVLRGRPASYELAAPPSEG